MKASKRGIFIFLFVMLLLILLAAFGIGDQIKGIQDMRYGIDIRGGVEAVFKPDADRTATSDELESARTIIETRLDDENIADREVTIDKQGGYIIVRFPWKSDETDYDPETAIQELGEMAELTFRDPEGNVRVEGKDVTSAKPAQQRDNGVNSYVVDLTFNSEGASKFETATGELIGQQMGIYMDDVLLSNPVVQAQIAGGQAVITGMENFDEAKRLADRINAGALPFALTTNSFSTISPSLGANALEVMVYAGLVAMGVVALFMIIVYRLPGIVAVLMLIFQMILQLLAISIPQYTLTLPGIAGIILSIGMAVDANVIIAERISEELKKGETVHSAVNKGYSKAFSAVLDGNITTAIVAIVLMIFGSGTMLSFGYTLLVGVIVNCFIGVNLSRAVLKSLLEYEGLCKESFFKKKKDLKPYKFFENRRFCAIVSGIIFLIGIVAIFVRGITLDTQFAGGAVLEYIIEDANADTEAVAAAARTATGREARVQISTTAAGNTLVVTLAGNQGISPETQKSMSSAIGDVIGSEDLEPSQTFAVEPYVGEKALKNAIIAVVLSFALILLYVGIRFAALSGLSAGVTAIIALLHDVCVVLFVFAAFGIPIGDSFEAVVLTIIGYSINDTIVVYDRIRENHNQDPRMGLPELINKSVTEVLSRSVNTSITTIFSILVILVASIMFRINSIYQFSLPMMFGLLSGCYSSICIASALWGSWKIKGNSANSSKK